MCWDTFATQAINWRSVTLSCLRWRRSEGFGTSSLLTTKTPENLQEAELWQHGEKGKNGGGVGSRMVQERQTELSDRPSGFRGCCLLLMWPLNPPGGKRLGFTRWLMSSRLPPVKIWCRLLSLDLSQDRAPERAFIENQFDISFKMGIATSLFINNLTLCLNYVPAFCPIGLRITDKEASRCTHWARHDWMWSN